MADNIQVVVRCRGRNDREIAAKSPAVVDLPNDTFSADEPFVSVNNEPASVFAAAVRASLGKVFRVDQVYGPSAEQRLLFDNVALPLFEDFVNGLNVTILAYGQTGSGKTYSMCGDLHGDHAGIIPRVLGRLFSVLDGDYMVKLSCVELYREELHDLINDELDLMSVKLKLRLVNESRDSQSTVIQNLTEVHIDNSEMGFKILKKCLTKRRTSATKLNDLSSRSHTIFTINLYRRAGSELEYRVSKMNLVDLAGSEDINKSGAVNERAREAGSINQSLLTLGKVINSLSEGKEPKHIPYRESKLTRLLQGSIGGKTKTALIATISPAKINAHETVSTLNYASKAKNIKNLPQSTHDSDMVLKRILVNDLSTQIARITRDLMASKDKDGGIKMSLLNYEQYSANILNLQSDLKEKCTEVTSLTTKLEARNSEIMLLQQKVKEIEESGAQLRTEFETKSTEMANLNNDLLTLQDRYANQKQQVSRVVNSNVTDINEVLVKVLGSLKSDSGKAGADLRGLTASITSHLTDFQSALRTKVTEVARFLDEDASAIQEILEKNINLSAKFKDIRSFDVTNEIASLQGSTNSFKRYLETEHLQPNLAPSKSILEDASKQLYKDTVVLKQQLLSQVSQAVEDIFVNNQSAFERSLDTTAQRLLADNRGAILQHSHKFLGDTSAIVNTVTSKAKSLNDASEHFEKQFHSTMESTSKLVADSCNQSVKKVLGDITNVGASETSSVIKHVSRTIDAIASLVDRTSASTVENLEQATQDLSSFHKVLVSLEESPSGKKSLTASPQRLPLSPVRFSPSAKRRRPVSPMKDNGLHRSKIPHLYPVGK